MLALFLITAFLVGCMLPWQPVVNARLGIEMASPLWAGFISFLGGALLLGALALLQGQFSDKITRLSTAPWWSMTGGLLGAIFVIAALILIPRIGATSLGVAFICGQLLMAVVMDHYGLAGLSVRPIDSMRFVGIVLVLVGVFMVMRPSHAS
ncbi:MAG: DMT family transporter [Bacteriovoracia bacterium]